MRICLLLFLFPFYLLAQVKERALNQNWEFRKAGDKEWLPATVPGTVHTDLFKNKKIGDPFSYTKNELAWIDTCDWEYRTFFAIDKDLLANEAEILFEGLDTYAAVYLNDSLVLGANNMFRSWKIKARPLLKEGKNELRVYFASAVKKGKDLEKQLPYTLPEGERVFTRKAQYHYGWDFAPRFVTCGIWKNVKLISWKTARIKNVQVFTDSISAGKAVLYFSAEVDCVDDGNYEFGVSCKEHKGTNSTLNTPIEKGEQGFGLMYPVPNPQLWWCNGMGEPFLYHFVLNLKRDGKIVDSKSLRVGIRDIELIREKDAVGESFYFKLNGKPVFMKGANLVPPDVFLPRTTKETYEQLVKFAARGNMNMLRVWGGGVYCDNSFYDLCDENGILIWQDLMFACAMYPGDKSFMDNVREEVKEQVTRLSSHPCLALWCGNNESDEGWKNWGWQKQFKYSPGDSTAIYDNYLALFTKTVPDILADGYQGAKYNYVPSSPQYGWGRKESMSSGDSHYWGVWWGMEPFEVYNKKVGRFMSEYGFQGMPSVSCVRSFAPYTIKPATEIIKAHQKHPKGFETIDTYLERDYKMPSSFENYVYVSQLVQARGIEIAIAAHRRNKPYCMGSLYWQLNDCWPGITWSNIDHSGVPKASYYAAKRSFRDVLVSFAEEVDSIQVWIISDKEQDLRSELLLALTDLSGQVLWNKSLPLTVEGGSSKRYYTLSKRSVDDAKRGQVVFKASLDTKDGSVEPARTLHYFVSPKDLELKKPEIKVTWLNSASLEISSDILAKNVFLDGGAGISFSDNYFDLMPGEKKLIKVWGHQKGTEPAVKITSLAEIN